MAWTYDDSLTGPKDQVRFLVGDTDSSDKLIADGEINFALLENSNVYAAAATVAQAIGARLTRELTLVGSAGSIELDAQAQAQSFFELAKELRAQAKTSGGGPRLFAGGTSKADKATRAKDGDRVAPTFTVDLHRSNPSNPQTGD